MRAPGAADGGGLGGGGDAGSARRRAHPQRLGSAASQRLAVAGQLSSSALPGVFQAGVHTAAGRGRARALWFAAVQPAHICLASGTPAQAMGHMSAECGTLFRVG